MLDGAGPAGGEPPAFRRILVGVNGSTSSRMALRAAVALARRAQGEITIVGVSPPPPWQLGYVGLSPTQLQDEVDEQVRDTLDDALRGVPLDVAARTSMLRGHVGRAIVAAAADHDVVMLGTRGSRLLGSPVYGGVPRYVRRRAKVPVIVLRCQGGAPPASAGGVVPQGLAGRDGPEGDARRALSGA